MVGKMNEGKENNLWHIVQGDEYLEKNMCEKYEKSKINNNGLWRKEERVTRKG